MTNYTNFDDLKASSLTVDGTVSASDLTASDDLSVGDDAAITGDVTIGGTLAVTGAVTVSGGHRLPVLKRIQISTTPTGAEQDTGFNFAAGDVVLDVFVDVDTAEATGATKTLDVGLLSSESGGDTDGFLDGVSVASTGVKRGGFASTTGSNNTYLGAAATHTIGALLTGLLIAGEDTAAGGDGFGSIRPHVINGTAVSLVYKAGSNDWAEFRGYLCVLYIPVG